MTTTTASSWQARKLLLTAAQTYPPKIALPKLIPRERGNLITVRLKGTFHSKSQKSTGENDGDKNRHRDVAQDHSPNSSQHFDLLVPARTKAGARVSALPDDGAILGRRKLFHPSAEKDAGRTQNRSEQTEPGGCLRHLHRLKIWDIARAGSVWVFLHLRRNGDD